MGIIDESRPNLLWITDFPLFEYDEEEGRFVAKHHPFTHPNDEDLEQLETNPGAVRARAYDMVLNGNEVGGGSIRINDPALQQRMFKALGFTQEEAQERFGVFDRRVPLRRAASRRHGLRPGPAGDADAGMRQHPGCDRLSPR